MRAISNMSDPTGKVYRPLPYATGACQALYLAEAMKIADKAGKLNGPGIKEALEGMKNFVPYGADGMCAAVTWTPTDHRSVEDVTIGRAKVTGETEQGDVAELVEKGILKIDIISAVKVVRKPEWQGY